MKNLKKINRENLRSINGGAADDCRYNSDCEPKGCAVCVTLVPIGTKTCMILIDPSRCPF